MALCILTSCSWLAGERSAHRHRRRRARGPRASAARATPATPIDGVLAEHRRVARALRHRRDVEVVVEPDGVVVLGRGLVGRRELSVELFDPAAVVGRRRATADRRRTAVRSGRRVVLGPGRPRQRPLPACLPGLRLHPDRLRGAAHLTHRVFVPSECFVTDRSPPDTPMTPNTRMGIGRVGRRGGGLPAMWRERRAALLRAV